MHHFDDGSEVQEARKRRVELVEPREEAPAALESPEQPFDLVPKLAGFPVAVPFGFPVRLRRHDRRHPVEIQKFCKKLSMKSDHGKSFGFAINHPLNRKGRHHDRDARQIKAGRVQG